jgi:short-subunit dehydrogenase
MHALVTGASGGIGEELAKQLAVAGYDLTLVALSEFELVRVIDGLAGIVETRAIATDLSVHEASTELVARAEDELGPIDLLVNNAGVHIVSRTPEVTLEAGERLLAVNLLTPLRLVHAVVPGMIARGRGTIVDVASLAGIAPTPGMVHYSASKAGLAAASEALRPELRPYGVHVVTVYPGPVQTGMAAAAVDRYAIDPLKLLPVGDPRTLAQLILRAVEQRRPRVIYPRAYWFARWFPGITGEIMARFSPLPTPKA